MNKANQTVSDNEEFIVIDKDEIYICKPYRGVEIPRRGTDCVYQNIDVREDSGEFIEIITKKYEGDINFPFVIKGNNIEVHDASDSKKGLYVTLNGKNEESKGLVFKHQRIQIDFSGRF